MARSGRNTRMVGAVCVVAIVSLSARAAAQMQADVTPVLVAAPGGPVGAGLNQAPGVEIATQQVFASDSPDVELGCVPANAPLTLLRFSLYTQNDGYSDLVFDPNDDPSFFFEVSPPIDGSFSYMMTDFGTFSLIDRTTGAIAMRTVNGQQVPVTAVKVFFTLASDAQIPYRPDAPCNLDGSGNCSPDFVPGKTDVTRGWYDIYDINDSNCQYFVIDGLPDVGSYDLVAEENTDRLMNCELPGVDPSNCPFDGRVYDNATAIRVDLDIPAGTVTFPPMTIDDTPSPIGPTQIAGPPAVVTHHVDTFDLFFVGTDGALYGMSQDTTGAWSNWNDGFSIFNSPAYPMAGTLAAVANDRLRTDLFGASTGGDVLRFSNDGTDDGTGFEPGLYGVAAQGLGASATPVAVASGPSSGMVSWVTQQGSVAYGTYNGSLWLLPQLLPGTFTAAAGQTPALTSSGDGMFHLFVRDGAGVVWYNQYFMGGWAGWQNLGGSVTGNLSAASPYLNRADVFAQTPDHHLVRNTWQGSSGTSFSGWIDDLGASPCAYLTSPGTACSIFDTRIGSAPTAISTGVQTWDVFFYDSSNLLWRLHWDGTAPSSPTPWTFERVGRISGVQAPMWPAVVSSWANSTFDLFQKSAAGQIAVRSMR